MTGDTTITAEEIKTALEKHFAVLMGNLICHNFALEKQVAALVERIQDMEEELVGLRPPPSSLSPELQAMAAEGSAAARGE